MIKREGERKKIGSLWLPAKDYEIVFRGMSRYWWLIAQATLMISC